MGKIRKAPQWATLADVFACCSSAFLTETKIQLPEGWDGIVPPAAGSVFTQWWSDLSADQQASLETAQLILDAATSWLDVKTGGAMSSCVRSTVWPCAPCKCGQGSCDCRDYAKALDFRQCLNGLPIAEIHGITVFEEPCDPETGLGTPTPLDPQSYRVDDDCILVRHAKDGCPDCWPSQDRNKPPGAPGTWCIDWTVGYEVDQLATLAAAQLACLWLSECLKDSSCCDKTPKGTTSMTRNGVTIRVANFQENLKNGYTGCTFADSLLDQYGESARSDYGGMYDPAMESQEVQIRTVTWPLSTELHPTPEPIDG